MYLCCSHHVASPTYFIFSIDLPSYEIFRHNSAYLLKRAHGKATCPQFSDNEVAPTSSHRPDDVLTEAIERIRNSFRLAGHRITLKSMPPDNTFDPSCSASCDIVSSFGGGLASLRYTDVDMDGFVSRAVQTDMNSIS
jgi:hypothetical protein